MSTLRGGLIFLSIMAERHPMRRGIGAGAMLLALAGCGPDTGAAPSSHTVSLNGVHHAPGYASPLTTGCTACHGASLQGGQGPSCTSCHPQRW